MLSIRDLSVSFSKGDTPTQALNEINYDIDSQKVIYIIGESGSGKTMLAQSIAGLLPQNAIVSGEIRLDSIKLPTKLEDKSNLRGNTIGYIFQDYLGSFSPVRTIGWHYHDVLNTMKVAKNKQSEMIKEAFTKLGFTDYEKIAKSYPHQLSGGQLQRLQIGLIIMQKPKIILADEITTALDAHIQNEMIKLTLDIAQSIDAVLIFITHDFRLVRYNKENIQSEIIVMYGGRIMEILSDISQYHHPYTALLLASVPSLNLDEKNDNKPPLSNISATNTKISATGCPFAPRCPNKLTICEDEFPAITQKNSRFYCHNPL